MPNLVSYVNPSHGWPYSHNDTHPETRIFTRGSVEKMERRYLQSKEFLEKRSARADRVNQKREFLAWQEDVIREAKHKAWLTNFAKAHEQNLIRFNELKSAKILDNNALQEM